MIETMLIKSHNKDNLTDKINTLNKKAVKIGCLPMTLTFGDDIVTKYFDEDTQRTVVEVTCDATLDYEIPIIDGWKLISTFDIYTARQEAPEISDLDRRTGIEADIPCGDVYVSVVTTSTVPGETVPTAFLNKDEIHCDHCGHNRRRNHSMLMMNVDTNEYKEVGSTCVKDFFGHDPVAFMRWASWDFETMVGELPEDEAGFGNGVSVTDLKETLIYAAATIRDFGWMSKGKAYDEGKDWNTAYEVENQMFNKNISECDRVKIDIEKDRATAEATIKYFSEVDTDNDYMMNCNKMVVLGYVPAKHMGLVVSMVPSAHRALAKVREAKDDTSEFVGNVGDKLKGIKAEVVFLRELQTDYGVSVLYIFAGTDGNTYKTFYTGSTWSVDEGDKVTLNGTVKKHDTYDGKKATLLTRVNVKIVDMAPVKVDANGLHSSDELIAAMAA
jgi:hypothetical protein